MTVFEPAYLALLQSGELDIPAAWLGPPRLRFLAEDISRNAYLNILAQYRPCHKACDLPPLDQFITRGICRSHSSGP